MPDIKIKTSIEFEATLNYHILDNGHKAGVQEFSSMLFCAFDRRWTTAPLKGRESLQKLFFSFFKAGRTFDSGSSLIMRVFFPSRLRVYYIFVWYLINEEQNFYIYLYRFGRAIRGPRPRDDQRIMNEILPNHVWILSLRTDLSPLFWLERCIDSDAGRSRLLTSWGESFFRPF